MLEIPLHTLIELQPKPDGTMQVCTHAHVHACMLCARMSCRLLSVEQGHMASLCPCLPHAAWVPVKGCVRAPGKGPLCVSTKARAIKSRGALKHMQRASHRQQQVLQHMVKQCPDEVVRPQPHPPTTYFVNSHKPRLPFHAGERQGVTSCAASKR